MPPRLGSKQSGDIEVRSPSSSSSAKLDHSWYCAQQSLSAVVMQQMRVQSAVVRCKGIGRLSDLCLGEGWTVGHSLSLIHCEAPTPCEGVAAALSRYSKQLLQQRGQHRATQRGIIHRAKSHSHVPRRNLSVAGHRCSLQHRQNLPQHLDPIDGFTPF